MTAIIGTSPPAVNAQPTAPAGSSPAAPADFMMLLAQIVGQPAQEAITPIPVQAALAGEVSEGEEGASTEAAELLPFSVAFFGADSAPAARVASEKSIGAAGVPGVAARALVDVQVVTDMIQSEQSAATETNADGEIFHLPLSGVDGSQHKAHATNDVVSRPIHVPVGNAQWADELGARLTTMTEQGRHAASLRLSPEHLGPLEIRIAIHDDQASVWFGAAHADTRAAIEHALPRLREMFEAQGMSLADAGVYHEAPREQPEIAPRLTSTDGGTTSADEPAASSVRVSIGLVDAYA